MGIIIFYLGSRLFTQHHPTIAKHKMHIVYALLAHTDTTVTANGKLAK